MKGFHEYGTRERLFEMMYKVNRLDEQILSRKKKNEIIDDFIKFCYDEWNIEGDPNNIEISYDPNEAVKMRSFGKQTPVTNVIRVVAANRNLADVLRTLAHEIYHRKQMYDGKLYNGAGDDGTEIENEANAQAGIVMRKYGRNNPIIFE